jgi:hypothetical protein
MFHINTKPDVELQIRKMYSRRWPIDYGVEFDLNIQDHAKIKNNKKGPTICKSDLQTTCCMSSQICVHKIVMCMDKARRSAQIWTNDCKHNTNSFTKTETFLISCISTNKTGTPFHWPCYVSGWGGARLQTARQMSPKLVRRVSYYHPHCTKETFFEDLSLL